MDKKQHILLSLYALAQDTRLDTFRLLIEYEPDGLAAGEIARALQIPRNAMSTHLRILMGAGLLTSQRRNRLIVYRANLVGLKDLTLYLVNDCCGGSRKTCSPPLEDFALWGEKVA